VLVPHGRRFLDSTHEYASDPENTRYMMHLPNPDRSETADFLTMIEREWESESPQSYEFAVLLDGEHIGACGLYITDEARTIAEAGWIFNKKYWGRGYASEAAAAVISYGVNELGFRKYIATCDSENTGSWRVMEKLGMQRIGCEDGRRNKSADRDSIQYNYAMTVGEEGFPCGRDTTVIRRMLPDEYPLLEDFLYEAIFIPEGAAPPPREIIARPELQVYVRDFGGRHDNALLALVDGKPAGAVWTRIMNDYGHVDDDTPSFAIALYEQYRGKGIGTLMMAQMLELLGDRGYGRASLAVQKANYAVGMYRKVGFEIVGGNDAEHIMLCTL